MKFLRAIAFEGNQVLINISNISEIIEVSETETLIYSTNSDRYIKLNIPFKTIVEFLELNSCNVLTLK